MTFLAEAPAGSHFAQFHREPDSLSASVYEFLAAGLRHGRSLVIIAGAALRDRLEDHLARNKLHSKALQRSGQLDIIDAGKLKAQIMPDGMPGWAPFRTAMAAVLSRAEACGRGVRIFGELSGILWNTGNIDAALRLEELWNVLAGAHRFSLYCGYTLDTQCEQSYSGPLEEVGHAHSEIVGSEEDERFAVALDRASKEIFGISLSQMAGITNRDGGRRFPSGQRTMLWVKRNLPLSTASLAERARRYFQQALPATR